MNHLWKKIALFLCVLTVLTGCSNSRSIKDLPPANDGVNVPKIRLSAIEQAASSTGAQGALAWTAKGINASLEKQDRYLNEAFNFRALLLNDNVLPPVLSEGDDAMVIDDPNTLRLTDKTYKIEAPPRFVTAPPIWRDYLIMSYKPPERPNITLMPRNREEQKVWNQYYEDGWKDGALQANQIFSANMGRLKRDYAGMILYRKLLTEKIVTMPFVAKSDLGITGDGDQIRVNDQILRITSTSKLVPDSTKWKTVVVPGTEGALIKQGTEGTETTE